jgi:hypothetical protein
LTSIAKTVEFAIFGNDVTYFGSVFLCMCMLLTIIRLCGFGVKKSHVITCLSLGLVMFAIIASSPMLPLYYTSLDIKTIDGATKLVKEYGALHPVYTVYLIVYFAAMIVTIIYSIKKKKLGKPRFAGFIAAIVGMNIAVWLFEKFVNWEYEFLSIIYVGSELLLIFVYWMIQEYVHKTEVPPPIVKEVEVIKEIEVIKEKDYNYNEVIYQDEVGLYLSQPFKKKELLSFGIMKIYNDRFTFDGYDKEFLFDDIIAVTLVGKKKMNIYVDDTTYQIFNNPKTNLLKYMHLFYVIKNIGGNYEFLGL